MTDKDTQRQIDAIFLEVVELDPSERSAFLDERCAGLSAEVRVRVEELLEADQQEHGLRIESANPFINVAKALNSTSPASNVPEPELERVGDYHLLQKLGEGGMGVVYMADQVRHVKRRVALKVIKPGMDSKQVIARFESERQALSMMDHPNIAKLLDVGVLESGRPYFVMELVKGVPITDYCDDKKLRIEDRLVLFEQVCQAVQHAHQKGIIHRDLKPSNILVAEYDDVPVPKIIDFGLAKAIQQPLTEKTLFTQFGQIVGTLDYMSPEQAKLNQLDVDTRTDVYSLGVLLYQLVVGKLPFGSGRLKRAAFDELLRIIREEDPPRPSSRLSDGEHSLIASAARRTDPRQLTARVAGDLDAIIMKSLEKDRSRRYQSAGELAKDTMRFLSGDSVEAVPPSLVYRSRKFVRRHRRSLLALTFVVLALLLAAIFSVLQWREAVDLAAEIDERRKVAEAAELRAVKMGVVSDSIRIAASEMDLDWQPIRSLVLAREAVRLTFEANGRPSPSAWEALLNATLAVGGKPLVDDGNFDYVVMNPKDATFVTTSRDGKIGVWSFDEVHGATLQSEITAASSKINLTVFSPDGRRLATSSGGQLRVWDLESQPPRNLATFTGEPYLGLQKDYAAFPLAFDPSGQLLAAAGPREADGQYPVHVWDLTSADPSRSPRVLRQHNDHVLACVFAKDFLLCTAGRDGLVCVWDLSNPEQVEPAPIETKVPGLRPNFQTHLAVDPNGKMLATKLGIYDIAQDGRLLEPLKRIGLRIVFSVTGQHFASLEKQTELRLSSLQEQGTKVRSFPDCGITRVLEFSQDERWLLGKSKHDAKLFDLENGTFGTRLRGHDGEAHWTISPDSKSVVSVGTTDGTARLWDVSSNVSEALGFCLPGPEAGITSLPVRAAIDVSPDSRWLASTLGTSQVLVWELGQYGPQKPLVLDNNAKATALTFHPVSGRLFVADQTGSVIEWDLASSSQVRKYSGLSGTIIALAVSPDASWLAASTRDEGTRIWSLKDESSGRSIDLRPNILGFSKNGRWMVTANTYGLMANSPFASIWDLSSPDGLRPRQLPRPSPRLNLHDVSLNSDGRWLILGYEDSSVRCFDLDAEDPLTTARVLPDPLEGPINAVCIQGDGQRAAAGSFLNDVSLLDLTDNAGKRMHHFPVNSPRSVAISDNGQYLAVGDGDGNVNLWNLNSRAARNVHLTKMKLRRHENGVMFTKFSGDGKWLITSDSSMTCVWPLEIERLMEIAERLAGRRLSDWERDELLPEADSNESP